MWCCVMKSKKTPFPKTFKPMLSSLVDQPPQDEGWLYEIKWDGYRALSFCNKDKVNIISRNNKSFNDKFYPIFQTLKKLKLNAVLDGEIVALDDKGMPSFSALQNWRSEADGELVYYIFDILWFNGHDLKEQPLIERKKLLPSIPFEESIRESNWFVTPPKPFLKKVKSLGLEGIIAKRTDSLYKPGERGFDWIKIKLQKRQEVVIGGFTINDNSPKHFSALLVGVYKNKLFHYLGKVGTGFSDKMQKEMMQAFKPLITKKCPFSETPDVNLPSRFRPNPPHAKAFWLKPKLVCEVHYTELTTDELMRHPSFVSMREDKNAEDVHQEAKPSSLKTGSVKQAERKTLLNPHEKTQVKVIKGHELKFTNLSKVYWPDEGYTKRDLLNYYYQVAPYIVPYLKNRPQSLNRFPHGIKGPSFYQKDVTRSAPSWIKQYPYHTSDGKDKNFLIVQDEADLLWMANLGAIEMNPWNSTIQTPDYPDWCIIDIDPTEKNSFDQVITVAKAVKDVLDHFKIEGYCKTSGGDGLHVFIPMGHKYLYDECQLFGRLIAAKVHALLPKFTSIERMTVNRKGKIYVDFLQNRPKATLAAPYSVRPKPGATVSMPLHWEEVKKGLHPTNFTIKNALERIKREGDLFKPVLGKGINLERVLKF